MGLYSKLFTGKDKFIIGLIYLLGSLGNFSIQMKKRNISFTVTLLIILSLYLVSYQLA